MIDMLLNRQPDGRFSLLLPQSDLADLVAAACEIIDDRGLDLPVINRFLEAYRSWAEDDRAQLAAELPLVLTGQGAFAKAWPARSSPAATAELLGGDAQAYRLAGVAVARPPVPGTVQALHT